MKKLDQYSLKNLPTCQKNKISLYQGQLTKKNVALNELKIKATFPSLPAEFYKVLANRIKENNFSDARLSDAVNHVIDNCVYPQPTIAQFISYDKEVKLYSYAEFMDHATAHRTGEPLMKAVRVPWSKNPMWALISDIEKYNLEVFNKE